MPNRLAHETSPYLLQHQDNPVDWYPWCDEAIEKARREEKPVFLSIGYSACHWCHVMEHESFENDHIAQLLNDHFVSIKVDREERPDLDQVYMNAVQMLTGHGGWPMSVFLTPDLKPFYGGTYWPATASRGMPGFDQILSAVHEAWQQRREQALEGADRFADELRRVSQSATPDAAETELSGGLIHNAVTQLGRSFDSTYGGFGGAPKFPQPMALRLLLCAWQESGQPATLDMVRLTLDRMAAGGIYDHLGGGFARYSVDARWLVPHFEKMLYDNALLSGVYLDAYRVTGQADYARVVSETLDYVLRDMTDAAGGFYSTEDADSEGEEGKFYTWSLSEIELVLGAERAATFARVYDVSEGGNFEGSNILNLPKSIAQVAQILERDENQLRSELAESRARLFEVREQRVRPFRDDKVLVAWNGLMIDSLARAGAVLDAPRYIDAAARAARFILDELGDDQGRLLHTWRDGQAKIEAYLDDYACLVGGLVSLYEATFDERWIEAAVPLGDVLLAEFADPEGGGFFFTARDAQQLITRTKDFTDASVPSGNGMAATVLVHLGKLLGRSDYLDAAESTLQAGGSLMARVSAATGQLLLALAAHAGPTPELVLVGELARDDSRRALATLHTGRPLISILAARNTAAAASQHRSEMLEPIFAGRQSSDGRPTLYVCENFTCHEPVEGVDAIENRLQELRSS